MRIYGLALRSVSVFIVLLSVFFLSVFMVLYQAPIVRSNIQSWAMGDLPPQLVELVQTYYPQISLLTYQNLDSYCNMSELENVQVESITLKYLCESKEQGYFYSTDEMYLFLSKKLIQSRINTFFLDNYLFFYSYYDWVIYLPLAFIFLQLFGFTVFFYNEKNIFYSFVEYILSMAFSCGIFGLFLIVVSLLVPGEVYNGLSAYASTPLQLELLGLLYSKLAPMLSNVFLIPGVVLVVFSLFFLFLFAGLHFYERNENPFVFSNKVNHRKKRRKYRIKHRR